MLIDRLRQIGKSYSVYVPSTNTDLYGMGVYTSGNLDRDYAQSNLNEVIEGTTWLDVATNSYSSANIDATIAIKSDGTLWSWGFNNGSYPIVGNNTVLNQSSPSQIGTDVNWRNVYGGGFGHFLAIKTDNTLWAWGRNSLGQLGDNTVTSKSSPVQIGTNWSNATLGYSHSMAIKTDGTLWGWGWNIFGQLGNEESTSTLKNFDGATNWSKVSAGLDYTMAIKTDGTLWGWGTNTIGRLGVNSTTTLSSPVQVSGGGNWKTVSANRSTTMAIKTTGTMWAWGEGATFRMGTGLQTDRSSPVQVGVDTDWDIVSIGIDFGHAIKTTGTLWSWGNNGSGQLGDGTRTTRSLPTQIGTDTNWKDVHQGFLFTLAVKTDGTLWSWGSDSDQYGVLGDNAVFTSYSSPNQIGALTDWDSIGVGDWHSCAIKTDGTLWCWGGNISGQLGDNTVTNRSSPVQIGTDVDWLKVSCGAGVTSSGQGFTAAIKTDGSLWTWGYNQNYQLAQRTNNSNRSSPVMVGYVPVSWSSVSTGMSHIMAISDNYELYTTPVNTTVNGLPAQTLHKSSPIQVGTDTNWKYVFGSYNTTYAIKTDNTLWHWGFDIMTRSSNLITSPTQIGTDTNWKTLAISNTNTYENVIATKTNGTLWAWGDNVYGQLGDGTVVTRTSPVQIGSNTDWSNVYNMRYGFISLAIKTNGTLWLWGELSNYNFFMDNNLVNRSSPIQLGNKIWKKFAINGATTLAGITTNDTLHTTGNYGYNLGNFPFQYTSPKQIGNTLVDIRDISIYKDTGFYIKSNGTLWGWGYNIESNLGNNSKRTEPSPIQIGDDATWSKVDVGASHTMAIKTNGTLWGWGYNVQGQVGDNTTITKSSPVQIGSNTDWTQISSGLDHTMAIKTNGTLWGWGYNWAGQVGDNTNLPKSSPVQIGVDTNWSKVSAGNANTFAIKTNGTLWAWGDNAIGQLGDETLVTRSSPVQIGSDTDWYSVLDAVYAAFAIKTNGTLWCWGQYGSGNFGLHYLRRKFFKVPKPFSATMISTSINTTSNNGTALIIDNNNKLWAWGLGTSYQLGDMSAVSKNEAKLIDNNADWSKVSSGYAHSMGIKTNGTLWGWGSGTNGRLGLNNASTQQSPVQIGADTDWSQISIRNANSYAIKTTGTLWGWGLGTSGQVGDNAVITRSSPVQIGASTDWSKISAGDGYCMAIKTTGTLWGWGVNTNGRIGDNTSVNKSSPVQIGADTDWTLVSSGLSHTMAIKSNGTLWGWGLGTSGQVGDNTIITKSSPVQIGADTDWSKVSAGFQYTLAVKTSGTLWAWGINSNYQMGIDTLATTDVRSSPVQVGSDTDWSDVFAGNSYSIAVKSNGNIYSTGDLYPLGTGYLHSINRSSPVQVGFDTNWSTLPSKYYSRTTIVKKTDGTLWGWGANTNYQLGDGTTTSKSSPIQLSSATDIDEIFTINAATLYTRSQTQ